MTIAIRVGPDIVTFIHGIRGNHACCTECNNFPRVFNGMRCSRMVAVIMDNIIQVI